MRINSVQSTTTAPPDPHGLHKGTALKQKAIYLLNTPSGLFIAVVHGTYLLESQCPLSCLRCSGKSKWLFHWVRYVKPLGQIAGTNRACCFPTFMLRSCGRSVSPETHQLWRGLRSLVTYKALCLSEKEAWLMVLYRCTSTCLVSLWPLMVNAVWHGC